MPRKDRFITGIFNTCDYWCARCAFTQRCRNFVMGREIEREAHGEVADKDATNAAFWNQLADQVREKTIFGAAADEAEEWEDAAEQELDATPDLEWQAREEAREHTVRQHPLTRMAYEYMKRADAWLKTADADLKAVAQSLLEAAGSKLATGDVEEEAREIGEMIEVVAWYHTLIPPKLARAIGGLLERHDDVDGEVAEILTKSRLHDANGTGKVVLIAIERSMAAWVRLREILPNHEDEILAMLALLSRMQRGIQKELPDAQTFRRPGFDGVTPADTDDEDGACV